MRWRSACRVAVALLALAGCGGDEGEPAEGEELGLGEIDDLKADGGWGAALTCKPLPDLPALASPEIVVSLDGLTLHLTDKASGFDKVFAIGPGVIEDGESLTPTSLARPGKVFWLRLDRPIGKETTNPKQAQPWAYAYSCKYWWKDPGTNTNVPVFAGLPFLRLEGAPTLGYAIHGPIDSYTLASGGKLRRGYVSHGCLRMEAADVLELLARCKGRKVPVRIQRSVERRPDGSAVDLDQRWVLSECAKDVDCNFAGGVCRRDDWSGRGFCTAPCKRFCPLDKWGYPQSFCVTDPEDESRGICTLKASPLNDDCRRYPGFLESPAEARFGEPAVKADACLPGSQGWIGSPCFTALDCAGLPGGTCDLSGATSRPGFCTMPCTTVCPDEPGRPGTACRKDVQECAQRCVLPDDCPTGYACQGGVCL